MRLELYLGSCKEGSVVSRQFSNCIKCSEICVLAYSGSWLITVASNQFWGDYVMH
jgi:hypothetical protein